jgi:ABC-type transport system substrate-binding protein
MVLEPKDAYWNSANEQFVVKKWTIKYYPDSSTLAMALDTGEVDIGGIANSGDYSRWLSEGSDDVNMVIINSGSDQTLSLGTKNTKAFDDIKVREALAYGVDWSAIGEMVQGDLFIPATSNLPSNSLFYKNVGQYPYDPDLAKQILADAGYKDGDIKIHLVDMSVDYRQQLDEALQFYCSQLGIEVDLEFGDMTSALSAWLAPGGSDVGWQANVGGVPSGEPVLSMLNWPAGGFSWRDLTDQPLIDMLNEAQYTVNQEKRKELYADIQQYLHDNFIAFPAYECVTVLGYRTDMFTEEEIVQNTISDSNLTIRGLSYAN